MTDKEAFDLIATHAIPCAQADGGPRQAPRVMNEAPKWTAIDEAMRWLNEVELVQGGANGPTIKLRAALLDIIKDANKSERRAVTYGDIVNSHILAMRAAVVAAELEGLDVGMQWIANTLCGPGHLPDLDEARELGGAQALWDKETAEHEAFRSAHPAPV